MSLLELQRQFRDHLLDAPSAIADRISGDSADLGLAGYHHAYRAQRGACLVPHPTSRICRSTSPPAATPAASSGQAGRRRKTGAAGTTRPTPNSSST